jgi:hypothetical protein
VKQIAEAVAPFAFDRIYGAWWDRVVEREGQAVVDKSVARYLKAIQ